MRTRSADSAGEPAARGDAGEVSGAIGLALAIGGVNAEKPQHAQIILGDPPARVADEAHPPCRDIVEPADVVMHDPLGVDRQAVDGEIAPFGIADPVAAERDPGLASEGLDVLGARS